MEKKAKPFQRDDNSWQCPTPLCLLDHNTELQSNKAGKKRGKYQINQLQISHSESGKTIHTCRGRTSYSVDQGQSALGISQERSGLNEFKKASRKGREEKKKRGGGGEREEERKGEKKEKDKNKEKIKIKKGIKINVLVINCKILTFDLKVKKKVIITFLFNSRDQLLQLKLQYPFIKDCFFPF